MQHGGDLTDAMKRHGGSLDDWLDLSTGINPWPWPIPADLSAATWQRLPSRADKEQLTAAARKAYLVPDTVAIVPAPGTQALIQWLPRLAAPGAVAIVMPTYSEHALSWMNCGRDVIPADALDRLPEAARHVVVVNPNSPDGRTTERAALADAGARAQRHGGWLVVDESNADLLPAISVTDLCTNPAVLVLRSFGKFHGLAGLRLGFAIAAPEVATRIATALGPWAVSGPALAIGRAALADTDWADRTRLRLAEQGARLDAVLDAVGLAVVGGTALFRLVRHARAKEAHEHLASRHIWTRVFEGRPDLLRFGLPPDQAGLDRLAAALGTGMCGG
jgi:cobalamin biosynthetic protein CobC